MRRAPSSTSPRAFGPAGRALDVPVGLCVGYLLDRALGDPRRWHPVAGIGRAIGRLERSVYADSRSAGVGFAATSVCATIGVGVGVDSATRRVDFSPVRIATIAAVTWAVLGGTTLNRVGREVADSLSVDDIDAARALVPSLCGRDPEHLDAAGIVRAAVVSIAENTSTATHIKVADIAVTDDGLGTNNLSLSGADASSFEIVGTGLYIKAGTALDFETKASYSVAVTVDAASTTGSDSSLRHRGRSGCLMTPSKILSRSFSRSVSRVRSSSASWSSTARATVKPP